MNEGLCDCIQVHRLSQVVLSHKRHKCHTIYREECFVIRSGTISRERKVILTAWAIIIINASQPNHKPSIFIQTSRTAGIARSDSQPLWIHLSVPWLYSFVLWSPSFKSLSSFQHSNKLARSTSKNVYRSSPHPLILYQRTQRGNLIEPELNASATWKTTRINQTEEIIHLNCLEGEPTFQEHSPCVDQRLSPLIW